MKSVELGVQVAGYTPGMKTAVSVPDDLFAQADRFAKYTRRSRSEVYSSALREYLARHGDDAVTEAMNRALAEVGDDDEEDAAEAAFVAAAARVVLANSEW
jgi:metal-responsive CopG/Arc/MetJ family transcriptional regulator